MSAFTNDDTKRLEQQLRESEGLRLDAYMCTKGVLTIGVGHNCKVSPVEGVSKVGDRITLEQAEALFARDLANAVWQVRKALPWVTSLNSPRQAVLYDMAYNMGIGTPGVSGLLSFRNTLNMVKTGDYTGASRGMLNSKWRMDVGFRAIRLSNQMDTGEW